MQHQQQTFALRHCHGALSATVPRPHGKAREPAPPPA